MSCQRQFQLDEFDVEGRVEKDSTPTP